jgi:hypothetical protein
MLTKTVTHWSGFLATRLGRDQSCSSFPRRRESSVVRRTPLDSGLRGNDEISGFGVAINPDCLVNLNCRDIQPVRPK